MLTVFHELIRDSVVADVDDAIKFIVRRYACRDDMRCAANCCECEPNADAGLPHCSPGDSNQFAFDSRCECAQPVSKGDRSDQHSDALSGSNLPIFRAGIDSGCTATCTDSIDRLINVRQCDENFKVADGKKSKCTAIGDMPVYIKDVNGKVHTI